MKVRSVLILICLIAGLTGCSVERQLNKDFKGKSSEELMLQMGRPTRVETATGGRTISVYEKSKFLKSAPINTGAFQYDKFESPKAIKTEVYRFYINSSGVIENVKCEVTYAK